MTSLPWRTVADALGEIEAGAQLVSSPGMGAPTTLLAGLKDTCAGMRWTLRSGILLGDLPFLPAVDAGELSYETWHVSRSVRRQVADGRVGYLPVRASGVPAMLRSASPEVALVRVSPPASDGTCSLGPSVSYPRAALDSARMVIAEIDEHLPRTSGDSLVHVSRFAAVVESASPVPEHHPSAADEVSDRIAAHVLDLLPHEPALQVGFGAVPEALVRLLPGSEVGSVCFVGMGTDDMVGLAELGLLRPRGAQPGLLSPELMGTRRVLAWAHENPQVVMAGSETAHDACRLGAIERLISVNTALQVDLQGNANCEVLRGRQISGPGGGPDFVEAAGRSAGGLSILALASTSPDGATSRLVPAVEAVTLSHLGIDAVVTEHGVARLRGRTSHQRAEALIGIAHPAFRDALADGVD